MTDERRLLNPPPRPPPCEPGGVSALTREEQGIVGRRPPLQHEGVEEKQSSHDPLGRITAGCCSAVSVRTGTAERGRLDVLRTCLQSGDVFESEDNFVRI